MLWTFASLRKKKGLIGVALPVTFVLSIYPFAFWWLTAVFNLLLKVTPERIFALAKLVPK